MFERIETYYEFFTRVRFLFDYHYEERGINPRPSWIGGDFDYTQVEDVLRIATRYPEYHVVTCIFPDTYVNGFVPNGILYFFAEGDSNPNLVFDPQKVVDELFIQSLNSGSNSSCT